MLSAADVGFDETRFVQANAVEKLMCPLCRGVPRVHAQRVSCCGKGACAVCLRNCGQQGNALRCPFCRQCAVVDVDRGYDDTLSLALVKCKYAPCCKWEGPYDTNLNHEAECEVTKVHGKLAEKDARLNEADDEVRALRAELRTMEEEKSAKETTIRNLEGQIEDMKETLRNNMDIAFKRNFMINAMAACPPAVLDAAHESLLPYMPGPVAPSSALCLAGSRSRSRSLRR